MKSHIKNNKGMSLVEVLVGATIIVVFIVVVVGFYNTLLKQAYSVTESVQASFLSEEGYEAIRTMRDRSWSTTITPLSTTTTYYLSFYSNQWVATTTNVFIDSLFERKFTLGDVWRDVNDDIASSGTYDAGVKKVTMTLSWRKGGATTTKAVVSYIANIFE
jgi:hypothetical protein